MKTFQYLLTAWFLVLPVLGYCPPARREADLNAQPNARPNVQFAPEPDALLAFEAEVEAEESSDNGSSGSNGSGSGGGNSGSSRSSSNGNNGGNGNNDRNDNNDGNNSGGNNSNGSNDNNGSKGGKKGNDPQSQETTTKTTSSTTTSTKLSTTTVSMFTPTTTTDTIVLPSFISSGSAAATKTLVPSTSFDVTSLLSSLSSSLSSETASVAPNVAPTTTAMSSPSVTGIHSSSSLGLPATSTSVNSTQSHESSSHRNLVISLPVVSGVLGVPLIVAAVYVLYHYLRGRRLFRRRGATPIHDDEIATWRVSETTEGDRENTAAASIIEKEPIPVPVPAPALVPGVPKYSMNMHHSGWTWSIRSSGVPVSPRPGFVSGLSMPDPDSPSFIARASNSRTGLTDAAIPGQEPFIQPVKRQSSRLSKVPLGHKRSKSGRSNMSAQSFMSFQSGSLPVSGGGRLGNPGENEAPNTLFDPDDEATWKSRRDSTHTSNSGTPDHSIFNGTTPLSPRPPTQARPGTRGPGRTIA